MTKKRLWNRSLARSRKRLTGSSTCWLGGALRCPPSSLLYRFRLFGRQVGTEGSLAIICNFASAVAQALPARQSPHVGLCLFHHCSRLAIAFSAEDLPLPAL